MQKMLRQAMFLIGRQFGKATLSKCEIFCVGDRPSSETLAAADDELGGDREAPVKIRYFPDFTTANQRLANVSAAPAVHLALITGITAGGAAELAVGGAEEAGAEA